MTRRQDSVKARITAEPPSRMRSAKFPANRSAVRLAISTEMVIGKAELGLPMIYCDHGFCALPPVAKTGNKAIAKKQDR